MNAWFRVARVFRAPHKARDRREKARFSPLGRAHSFWHHWLTVAALFGRGFDARHPAAHNASGLNPGAIQSRRNGDLSSEFDANVTRIQTLVIRNVIVARRRAQDEKTARATEAGRARRAQRGWTSPASRASQREADIILILQLPARREVARMSGARLLYNCTEVHT